VGTGKLRRTLFAGYLLKEAPFLYITAPPPQGLTAKHLTTTVRETAN